MSEGKVYVRDATVSRFDAMFSGRMVFRMGGDVVVLVDDAGAVFVLGERVPNLVTDIRAWGKPVKA